MDCYQWGNQKVYCGDDAYDKALKQGQAIYQTGWREAENVSTISIEQLGVGVEFKFPQDWFEPPFTEFVLVSKEELSDDEWKIVFDPLVKKGVSNIEATIPSDTRFVLLQEMDFGYESTDDDDYLPDKFQAEYQPNQTLGDYSPEQLTESSAIEGYQPLKYSVVGNRAETFEARDNSWCVNHGWIHAAKIGDIIPCTSCNDMICDGCRCGGCGNCENSDCCECKNAETFHADSKEEARLKKYEKTYGKEGAKVRNRIFKRILAKAQDGTKAGQWSARKAQSLAENTKKKWARKAKIRINLQNEQNLKNR